MLLAVLRETNFRASIASSPKNTHAKTQRREDAKTLSERNKLFTVIPCAKQYGSAASQARDPACGVGKISWVPDDGLRAQSLARLNSAWLRDDPDNLSGAGV